MYLQEVKDCFERTPVIAGGLIETKQEITEALKNGAEAISTGKQDLWYV